jgi:hypothetical protein
MQQNLMSGPGWQNLPGGDILNTPGVDHPRPVRKSVTYELISGEAEQGRAR